MSSVPRLSEAVPELEAVISNALAEDLGEKGDITTVSLFPEPYQVGAEIVARERGVLAGLPAAKAVFGQLSSETAFTALVDEGQSFAADQCLAELKGDVRAVLAGERTALNLVGRLSGIATLTSRFVAEAGAVKIRDTRKTTPGLRSLEKYAVAVGGGFNHRKGLFDGVIIKDNHLRALGEGLKDAVAALLKADKGPVEVEVETMGELEAALTAGVNIIMLDNMSLKEIEDAVVLVARRAMLEVSGGVDLENVAAIAETGVDWISVGALTHGAASTDISLEIIKAG